MLVPEVLAEGTNGTFATGLGSVLTGVSELLLALGAGFGFIIRYRQNARKAEEARRDIAAQAAKEAAERLDRAYEERIEQYEETIERMERASENTSRLYEEKLTNLQNLNTRLVNQILKLNEGKQ